MSAGAGGGGGVDGGGGVEGGGDGVTAAFCRAFMMACMLTFDCAVYPEPLGWKILRHDSLNKAAGFVPFDAASSAALSESVVLNTSV